MPSGGLLGGRAPCNPASRHRERRSDSRACPPSAPQDDVRQRPRKSASERPPVAVLHLSQILVEKLYNENRTVNPRNGRTRAIAGRQTLVRGCAYEPPRAPSPRSGKTLNGLAAPGRTRKSDRARETAPKSPSPAITNSLCPLSSPCLGVPATSCCASRSSRVPDARRNSNRGRWSAGTGSAARRSPRADHDMRSPSSRR